MLKMFKSLFFKSSKDILEEQTKELLVKETSNKIEDLYFGLVEFWSNVNLDNFNVQDNRTLSKVIININHKCVIELINNLETITRLLKAKDYVELSRFGTLVHKQSNNPTLEFYFSTDEGFPLLIVPTLHDLKVTLTEQRELLLKLENLNKLWPLSEVYNDLMVVTKACLKHLVGDS